MSWIKEVLCQHKWERAYSVVHKLPYKTELFLMCRKCNKQLEITYEG